MTNARERHFALSAGAHAVALALVVLYFLSYLTVAPNSSDGAVMLDYVHRTSRGQRVYFDFFDYYGPLAWWLPGRFYALAGQKEIGVRIYLLIVKIASVLVTYGFIRRFSDALHAVLGALMVAALLGQPWTFFQIPYAPHLTFPLVLATWLTVLWPSERRLSWRVVVAGALVAATAWIKVSTGAFSLAGTSFYLAFWLPRSGSRPPRAGSGRAAEAAFRLAQLASLAGIVIAFHLFLGPHFRVEYFAYLSLPLVLVAAWTAREIVGRWKRRESTEHHAVFVFVHVATAIGCWALYLLAHFGRSAAPYLAEQVETIRRLRLETPFLAPSTVSPHAGQYLWMRLPWLGTALGATWVVARIRTGGESLRNVDATVAGLWAMVTLHAFVMVPRLDDAHLIQAVLPAVALLFVLAHRLEGLLTGLPRARLWARSACALGSVVAVAGILELPPRSAFAITAGDWNSPRLRYLTYHAHGNSDLGDVTFSGMSYAQWDHEIDEASRLIDSLTEDGEEVLITGRAQLLNYASNTTPFGGRYSHFFYLLRSGLLDRRAFLELVPREVVDRFLHDPPRVLVTDGDRVLQDTFPEIEDALVRSNYRLVGRWRVVRVYLRGAQGVHSH